MLHKNNIVMDTVNVIDENKSQVILRIVPVKIRDNTTIETYALCALYAVCGEASTTTLIHRQIAKFIGLQGTTVSFLGI
jgi:predicted transcriptional regulator